MSTEQNPAITSSQYSASGFKANFIPWVVCLVSGLFFFYEFIQMNMLNSLAPHLMKTLSISGKEIGELAAYYFYADVIMLFPAGILLDRLSIKRLMIFFMCLCILSNFIFASATSLEMAKLARFMEGFGAAFCFTGSLTLAARWIQPRHTAIISGLLVTMAMLGGVIAQTPLTLLIDQVGWRPALFYLSGVGVLIILIIAFVVKDYPPGKKETLELPNKKSLSALWESIKIAVCNLQNIFSGVYTCLINLPILLLGGSFGNLYLTQMHHLSLTQAAQVSAMIFVGTIFGSPAMGLFSDLIGRRKLPMMLGGVLSIATVLILMYWPGLTYQKLLILFFLLGFLTSSQVITYPLVNENNQSQNAGAAFGITSSIIMSGGAIFAPLFGLFLQLYWNGEKLNNVPLYSPEDYHRALLIFPLSFLIGLAATFFLKETFCRKIKFKSENLAANASVMSAKAGIHK